jgi:hypothetical protein
LEEKRTPVIAGMSGAALVAALMSFGGPSSPTDAGAKAPHTAVTESSSSQIEMTSNQEGPWYAFCQEYATTEFDHGEDPSQERGIKGHQVPQEAEEGTVEVTRTIKGGAETEKFHVRKHTVGDLPSCVPHEAKVRVAIAMVPDPNATQMPLEFDRDIEAIQAAAAAEHYNYTRFWFPWRSADWMPEKSADPEAELRRREEPGILCFRQNDHHGGQERLFVLLVGETPTSGTNRLQFAHALYYRQQLGDAGKIDPIDQREIDIAAPHFSASFKAIQDVLKEAIYKGPPSLSIPVPVVKLVSPDASGQEYLDEFRNFCASQLPKCALQTLSISSGDVTGTAIDYLRQLGYRPSHIAQWVEDESAFGAREFNDPNRVYGLTLRFPRDLSSARTRSDEESAKVAESGSKYFSLPGDSLPTLLSAKQPTDRDSPAAFGSEQEAAEVARSLANSVEEIHAHRIRAVVISASNPLDRIYLLEYLHTQLPDIRIATTDADALELDRPHFVDLTGVIAITALPTLTGMVNVIQRPAATANNPGDPTPPTISSPMTFKSSRQEGEFLAMEMIFDRNHAANVWPQGPPCYSISVVGESGFRLLPYLRSGKNTGQAIFPCLVSTGPPDTSPPNVAPSTTNATPFAPAIYFTVLGDKTASRSFVAFMGLVVIFNILHFLCVAASRRGIERPLSYPRPLVPSMEPTRVYLLFVVNNQLTLLNLLASIIGYAALNAADKATRHDAWLTVLFWCVAPLTVVTLSFSGYLLKIFFSCVNNPDAGKKDKSAVLGMVITLLYLGSSIWMLLSMPALREHHYMFLERVTRIGDGLSPVLPIASILLAYLLWGCVQLKRLDWAASRRAHLTVSPGVNEYFHSRLLSLQENLEALDPAKPSAQTVGTACAALIAFLFWNSLNGFDGDGFRLWLVVWGVVMLLLTVVLTCLHASSIWASLKKMLDWLEATSMRETFEKLSGDGLLQIKIWDLTKTQKSFAVLSRTVDSIELIEGKNSVSAREADKQFQFILRADATHRQLPPGRIDRLSNALNVRIDDALRSIDMDSRMNDVEDLRRYLALRIVALIRYAILQIGILISFVAYGYVLAVISVMFYPFEGRKTLSLLVVATFVALLIWIGVMMAQFQRNGMLSRLEGSTPGQVSYAQLALHLLTVGGLPLLAVVTSQFPAIAKFAYTVFRPVLGALH